MGRALGLVIGSKMVSPAEFEGEVVRLVHSYLHNGECLRSILDRYGATSPDDIEKKISEGKLPEHPTYEEYLEALARLDVMRSSLEDLRRVVGVLETEIPR